MFRHRVFVRCQTELKEVYISLLGLSVQEELIHLKLTVYCQFITTGLYHTAEGILKPAVTGFGYLKNYYLYYVII